MLNSSNCYLNLQRIYSKNWKASFNGCFCWRKSHIWKLNQKKVEKCSKNQLVRILSAGAVDDSTVDRFITIYQENVLFQDIKFPWMKYIKSMRSTLMHHQKKSANKKTVRVHGNRTRAQWSSLSAVSRPINIDRCV